MSARRLEVNEEGHAIGYIDGEPYTFIPYETSEGYTRIVVRIPFEVDYKKLETTLKLMGYGFIAGTTGRIKDQTPTLAWQKSPPSRKLGWMPEFMLENLGPLNGADFSFPAITDSYGNPVLDDSYLATLEKFIDAFRRNVLVD